MFVLFECKTPEIKIVHIVIIMQILIYADMFFVPEIVGETKTTGLKPDFQCVFIRFMIFPSVHSFKELPQSFRFCLSKCISFYIRKSLKQNQLLRAHPLDYTLLF